MGRGRNNIRLSKWPEGECAIRSFTHGRYIDQLCSVSDLPGFSPISSVGHGGADGIGTVAITLAGRPDDTITTGITIAVVMVVAAINPHNAWQQPILRLVDTAVGIAVGVGLSGSPIVWCDRGRRSDLVTRGWRPWQ